MILINDKIVFQQSLTLNGSVLVNDMLPPTSNVTIYFPKMFLIEIKLMSRKNWFSSFHHTYVYIFKTERYFLDTRYIYIYNGCPKYYVLF